MKDQKKMKEILRGLGRMWEDLGRPRKTWKDLGGLVGRLRRMREDLLLKCLITWKDP